MSLTPAVEKENSLDQDFATIAACPTCRLQLITMSSDELVCPTCHSSYRRVKGIWRFLTLEQQLHYSPFIGAYGVLRYCEGWERTDNGYYLGLPNVPANDPKAAIWKIRQQSFKALISRLPSGSRRWSLDLGAGNCWLSHHLTLRGYRTLAFDIRVASRDALEGGNIYQGDSSRPFIRGQASADALPISDEQIDLCVINDTFHYLDILQTLKGVYRILRPGGMVIIMDSPIYHSDRDGRKMIEQQRLYLQERYRINNAPVEGKGYLVLAETLKVFQDTGFSTEVHWLERPAKWWRRLRFRPKAPTVQLELVRFPLIVAKKPVRQAFSNV